MLPAISTIPTPPRPGIPQMPVVPTTKRMKQDRMHDFMLRSLLGEDFITTKFYLFTSRKLASSTAKSAEPKSSGAEVGREGRATRPKALFTNDGLLVRSSEYFSKLLVENEPTDGIVDLGTSEKSGRYDFEDGIAFASYGYSEDSDLDDEEEEENDDKGENGGTATEKDGLDARNREKDWHGVGDIGGRGDGQAAVWCRGPPFDSHWDVAQEKNLNEGRSVPLSTNNKIPSLRTLFVKHAAFKTWKALLFYQYTEQINFLPLRSQTQNQALSAPVESEIETSSTEECGPTPRLAALLNASPPSKVTTGLQPVVCPMGAPACSPKSMYRLATRIGLGPLKKLAFDAIVKGLSKENILEEISSEFTSMYPEILEAQMNVLYRHISSQTVVEGFPALAERIAGGRVVHGAALIVELHRRMLSERAGDAPPLDALPAVVFPVVVEPPQCLGELGLGRKKMRGKK